MALSSPLHQLMFSYNRRGRSVSEVVNHKHLCVFLPQNQHIAGDKPLLVGCCIGGHLDNATSQATKDDRE